MEEERYKLSMANIHVLYAHELTLTFRLETLTPPDIWDAALMDPAHEVAAYYVPSGLVQALPLHKLLPNRQVQYRGRGWCKAELEWSSTRSTTCQNQRIDRQDGEEDRSKLGGKVPMAPDVFKEAMDKSAFTHRDDAEMVLSLHKKIFHEKVSACQDLKLENLPETEVAQLVRALPHYKYLRSLRLLCFKADATQTNALMEADHCRDLNHDV